MSKIFSPTRDRDVRALVLAKVLSEHVADPDVRVVEELGIEHGICRVDIAVINGFIHGYELKSDADTLLRLPAQVEAYGRSLDRSTLVVGAVHLAKAEKLLPDWWGIKVVVRGPRGALKIETHRSVLMNPDPSPFHMCHLLWKDEVITLLTSAGVASKELRKSRKVLYELLVEAYSPTDLKRAIRATLKSRENWRPRAPLQ